MASPVGLAIVFSRNKNVGQNDARLVEIPNQLRHTDGTRGMKHEFSVPGWAYQWLDVW